MNIQDLKNMIENTNGKIFAVVFRKKDGTMREMNARLGVRKHLRSETPKTSTTSHIDKYVTVYDMKSEGYRNINLETLVKFKCGTMEVKV